MHHDLNDLRVADVATFLSVYKSGSLTATARQIGVTTSQVSKAIARLEGYLKSPLVERRGRGVTPTDGAKAMHAEFEELVRRARDLPLKQNTRPTLTIGAPSYLATACIPKLGEVIGDVQLRAIEAGGTTLRVYAAEDVVQLAITPSPERLTRAWVSTQVGELRQSLYTSPDRARSMGRVTASMLRTVPFVLATHYANGEFQPGNDECPIPRGERSVGHEAATIGVALEIAASCHQLVYGPEIATRPLVEQGRLVEVRFPGLRRAAPLFVHVNAERVLARVQKAILKVLGDVVDPPDSRELMPGLAAGLGDGDADGDDDDVHSEPRRKAQLPSSG